MLKIATTIALVIMPPKRKASGDSAPSTPSKIPKLEKPLDRDIATTISRLRNIASSTMGDVLCNQITNDIVSRDDKIIQLKEEIMRLQAKQGNGDQVTQQQRKEHITLEKSTLDKVMKNLDQAHAKTKSLQDFADTLKQSVDEAKKDAQSGADRIAGARLQALALAKDIEAWKEANKNLRLAESSVSTTGSDAGRADPPEGLPSHLLDREIAEKIVDHYEKRATRSMLDIRKFLEHPEHEADQGNV
ncbi:hypothetical protein PGQ11_012703 [Apiospora arundinis]|uniref:Uncharacterized protein n=1 Tax=Apiospora arundinis TaxID=335852 RepID=A0ABR2I383_9PEZI